MMGKGRLSPILIALAIGLGAAMLVGGDSGGGGGQSTYDVDVRDEAATVRYDIDPNIGAASGAIKRDYRSPRPMSSVKGITIHHVAVENVGVGAIHKMTYHVVVHHDGKVYWVHPFDTYLLHGNGFNKDTIAISLSGSFGDPDTELPPAQAEGLRRAIRWVLREARAEGADIREVWTHRQSSASRGLDPGRAPYQKGVLYAERELGLQHNPDATRGDGLKIPESWKSTTASGVGEEPNPRGVDESDEAAAEPWEIA